jgi:peptidoglycan/LPS O-acetylase OafA/YrhL
MHHFGLRVPLRHGVLSAFLPKWVPSALIYNGYEAVFVFFVVSGFLIATNTLARCGSLGALRAGPFYARRAARIVPCLVLLVAVLCGLHLAGVREYVISRANQSLGGAVGSAFGLHLNWYEGVRGYLPGSWDVLWSLSIEEVFYLGFPLLCLGVRRKRFLVPILTLLALSLPASRAALAARPIWQEKAYLPGMAGIATGVLAALGAAGFRPRARWAAPGLLVLGGLGLFSVLCFESRLWAVLGNGSLLVLTGSSALLVAACHWRAQEGRPLTLPGTGWLRSFGRLSYEIYLTHMFVVFLGLRIFRGTGAGLWWGILWYAPVVLGSWVLGWLVARYLSVPGERALRQWVAE